MWRCKRCRGISFIEIVTITTEEEVAYNSIGDQTVLKRRKSDTSWILKCAECGNKKVNGYIGEIARWEEE